MPPNHTRLLARIKLRETERQRDRLRTRYDEIQARVAAAGSPLDRLRALHAGLRGVTFAQKPLHPVVNELDALYLADALGVVPPELVAERTRFLEHELAQGRLRAEFTYAFGRVLSEWVGSEDGRPAEPAEDPFSGMFAEVPTDTDWLRRFAADNRGTFEPVAARITHFAGGEALRPVAQHEVLNALGHVSRDRYLNPVLRRQASEAAASTTQATELAGVCTILLNSLGDWDWPEEGVPLRAAWVGLKHRPYLDEDLVTAVFLGVVGRRWADTFRAQLRWEVLQDGKEPLFPPEPPDSPTAVIGRDRLHRQGWRFMAAVPSDTATHRGMDVGYAGAPLLTLLETVEREVRFRRAAFPERPCHVVQADLRDFYPSLPHAFVLEVLRRIGVPDRWLGFFGKFLAARVRYRGEVQTVRRGVALEHALSDVLAEVVLWVLDLHVLRTAGTPPVRLVDDIWILSDSDATARAGWDAVREFCRATGLEVNDEKSGAVCVGDENASTAGLPAGRPRWGFLRLQPHGEWAIDEAAFQKLEALARTDLAASPSVLALVAKYNGYLGYAIRQLALPVTLLGDHLRRAGQRLHRMHTELFGPGHGLVEEVGRRLRDCFADARLKEQGLPHALLYWPITAGGLALSHPLMHAAAHLRGRVGWRPPLPPNREAVAAFLWFREADARKQPLTPTEESQIARFDPEKTQTSFGRLQLDLYRKAVALGNPNLPESEEVGVVMAQLWAQYYHEVVTSLSPAGPPGLPAMEQLVQDFISRGGEVSGRAQAGLSPYWRWVVYAYGPSLLESLGTFRFLLTELVPLQLILENRGLASGLSDDSPRGDLAGGTTVYSPSPPPAAGSDGDDIPF